ncbi:hypothetical protein QN277_005558 [Acacia crassicarpa]|uniref:Signal peptidase complex-like protein DTM1 n=1 Tax=Acacia crassicarpa TaxID=499986 RepID=A0AAE1IYI7_9FABA|nr:hypothetical protein QN277_005558 [Acacia crassicarpa]
MGNDDNALKTCLLWLAAIIVVVGFSTRYSHKMLVTYLLGVLGIVGDLLPDWDYFNRHFSRWPYPVTADERASLLPHGSPFLWSMRDESGRDLHLRDERREAE